MSDNLTQSLLITAIGMGLVFAAIVLFWFLMSVLVRFAGGRAAADMERDVAAVPAGGDGDGDRALRQRAAAVAVTVALAHQDQSAARLFPLPAAVLISTWQSVNRARLLGRRGSVR